MVQIQEEKSQKMWLRFRRENRKKYDPDSGGKITKKYGTDSGRRITNNMVQMQEGKSPKIWSRFRRKITRNMVQIQEGKSQKWLSRSRTFSNFGKVRSRDIKVIGPQEPCQINDLRNHTSISHLREHTIEENHIDIALT